MSDNLFEKASRLKLRFPSIKGVLTVEDLWDLPLMHKDKKGGITRTYDDNLPKCLNDLAKLYNKQLKEDDEDFVGEKSSAKEKLELNLEIVKYIIEKKKAERDQQEKQAVKASRKQKLMELIAQKEEQVLSSKSLEELQAELENL